LSVDATMAGPKDRPPSLLPYLQAVQYLSFCACLRAPQSWHRSQGIRSLSSSYRSQ